VPNQLAVFQAGSGVEGTDEYAALEADNSKLASGLPQSCLVTDPLQELGESDSDAPPIWFAEQGSCDETYTADVWQAEHKILQMNPDHDGYVVLRLRRYPAWQVMLNGQAVPQQTVPAQLKREDGLMVIPVSAGPAKIEVRLATTPDLVWGRWTSGIAFLILLSVVWIEGRNSAGRLS